MYWSQKKIPPYILFFRESLEKYILPKQRRALLIRRSGDDAWRCTSARRKRSGRTRNANRDRPTGTWRPSNLNGSWDVWMVITIQPVLLKIQFKRPCNGGYKPLTTSICIVYDYMNHRTCWQARECKAAIPALSNKGMLGVSPLVCCMGRGVWVWVCVCACAWGGDLSTVQHVDEAAWSVTATGAAPTRTPPSRVPWRALPHCVGAPRLCPDPPNAWRHAESGHPLLDLCVP